MAKFKSFSKLGQIGDKKKNKTTYTKQPATAKVTSSSAHMVNDLEVDSELDLFLLLYKNGTKKSYLSGKKIMSPESRGMSLFVGQFAHVLAKGKNKYPYFKMYSENIIQLTNEEHLLLDNGTEDQRKKYGLENNCDWSKVYELRDKLKEEYDNLIK